MFSCTAIVLVLIDILTGIFYYVLVVSLLRFTCPSKILVVIGQPTLPEYISKSYLALENVKADEEHAAIKIPIEPVAPGSPTPHRAPETPRGRAAPGFPAAPVGPGAGGGGGAGWIGCGQE